MENSLSFDELLTNLHDSASLADSQDETNFILIDNKRQFEVGSNFDTIVAYEGDINSQITTFKSIRYSDGHDLYACAKHEIRWKNLTSGIEGVSELQVSDEKEASFLMKWEIPSELCTQAGNIEISIAYYDYYEEEVVYSWNTSTYTGLSIGKSMDSVGFQFPAKDEILVINNETRNIVAPPNYNNVICNYGDIGVASVYFLIDRYIGKKDKKIDVYSDNTTITIYAKTTSTNKAKECSITNKKLYTKEISNRNNEGLVFFEWEPDVEITSDSPEWIENIEIYINFLVKKENTEIIDKSWNTSVYNKLKLGKTMTISSDAGENAYISSLNTLIDKRLEEQQVDDVLEYPSLDDFPKDGKSGILYISQKDGATYRWGTKTDQTDGYIEVGLSNQKANNLIKAFLIENNFIIDANQDENQDEN